MIIELNEMVKAGPTVAAKLALTCGFKNLLFFCLHFAKTLTITLQLRKIGGKYLESDIVLKIKLKIR